MTNTKVLIATGYIMTGIGYHYDVTPEALEIMSADDWDDEIKVFLQYERPSYDQAGDEFRIYGEQDVNEVWSLFTVWQWEEDICGKDYFMEKKF